MEPFNGYTRCEPSEDAIAQHVVRSCHCGLAEYRWQLVTHVPSGWPGIGKALAFPLALALADGESLAWSSFIKRLMMSASGRQRFSSTEPITLAPVLATTGRVKDVAMWNVTTILSLKSPKNDPPVVDSTQCDNNLGLFTHHNDGDATAHISHHSDGRLLLGDQHCTRRKGWREGRKEGREGERSEWKHPIIKTPDWIMSGPYGGSPCWGGWLRWSWRWAGSVGRPPGPTRRPVLRRGSPLCPDAGARRTTALCWRGVEHTQSDGKKQDGGLK